MSGLRDYQVADIERIIEALKAHRSTCYVLPTGGGKTIVLSEIARRIHSRGYRTLMLVHRRELVDQAIGTLKKAMPGISVGVEASGWPSIPWADLHVGMVQSIVRRQVVTPPHVIAIDEAHHARAATWEKVLARWPTARRLGLTATPRRLDGKGLSTHFASMVMGPTPMELIDAGWLAPVRTLAVDIVDPASFRVSKATGDYRDDDVDRAMTDKVVADSARAYLTYATGLRAIFFGANISHSERVAAELRELGVAAEHVDGTDHTSRRDHVMGLFRQGALDVLCNVGLVDEGFDVPECECVILGRPTKSTTRFLQCCGRSMRPGPGKTAIVLDLGGSAYELGTADETREWSLDDGEVETQQKKRHRACPRCRSVLTKPPPCPFCGWMPDAIEQQQWKEMELKLVELKARKKRPRAKPRLTRRELRARLAACHRSEDPERAIYQLAEEVGYKPGWADHIIQLRNTRG